ncbi:MAG: TraR/DksA C4-type zinc finger protein [Acidipropionibacterium acidipropionici]|jgi:DnaK suppressor protein|uniref:DNA-binding protein n=2 Tax=Acidipropionibacterium acidipropionici TaxID=1748 RepID=A0A142KL09_9ACTN|nr:TraR/DksA C4-type zinc finger protein [Acidipropionibacterium acidipropionici]AFV89115.1 C4-type zinc finger protein, DksA/TraR family [Acidipropionibacterium acidipropionici ATCC 4875]ALN16313.1 DNA-binding protein [Acidipropionibacterium acidipropionici]AMS06797.1 DNA-binding protein [Acidipropionibacterium acidipropionici]AOZ45583.1 DNA-binding protein [Acidipropionibacterium acidipropionici]APZ07939.1 DNA-binding protein [Acidipropionibacterium acidipropionici]
MSQQDAESRVADLAAALPVREGDEPWTAEEVTEVVTTLRADVERMGANLAKAQTNLADLMTEGSDGAGKDPADVGSSQFERDQEISLTRNAQLVYDQSRLALKLIEEGTYGTCENCGRPIGKARLQAFPRATMCVACKQREERR